VDRRVYRAARAAVDISVPELARQERRPCLEAPQRKSDQAIETKSPADVCRADRKYFQASIFKQVFLSM
jgi:hypothetical protein